MAKYFVFAARAWRRKYGLWAIKLRKYFAKRRKRAISKKQSLSVPLLFFSQKPLSFAEAHKTYAFGLGLHILHTFFLSPGAAKKYEAQKADILNKKLAAAAFPQKLWQNIFLNSLRQFRIAEICSKTFAACCRSFSAEALAKYFVFAARAWRRKYGLRAIKLRKYFAKRKRI